MPIGYLYNTYTCIWMGIWCLFNAFEQEWIDLDVNAARQNRSFISNTVVKPNTIWFNCILWLNLMVFLLKIWRLWSSVYRHKVDYIMVVGNIVMLMMVLMCFWPFRMQCVKNIWYSICRTRRPVNSHMGAFRHYSRIPLS